MGGGAEQFPFSHFVGGDVHHNFFGDADVVSGHQENTCGTLLSLFWNCLVCARRAKYCGYFECRTKAFCRGAAAAAQVKRILQSGSNAFDVLDLPRRRDTDEKAIQQAFRRVALAVHPDKVKGCTGTQAACTGIQGCCRSPQQAIDPRRKSLRCSAD